MMHSTLESGLQYLADNEVARKLVFPFESLLEDVVEKFFDAHLRAVALSCVLAWSIGGLAGLTEFALSEFIGGQYREVATAGWVMMCIALVLAVITWLLILIEPPVSASAVQRSFARRMMLFLISMALQWPVLYYLHGIFVVP